MGNCQAAEAAAVVIQHPGGGKVERIYWSVTANDIMNENPGHYVAQLVAVAATTAESGAPVKQLKLLRPDDTLVMGQVYRLVSFEDVLKEFAAKKCVKLGKLLKERGPFNLEPKRRSNATTEEANQHLAGGGVGGGSTSSRGSIGRLHGGGGQWRPALQSISELGT
ncbi:DUF4228 domain protein [Perilla frutescens var. hirtella]|nr:DUF4228 domain protein [Perilla frutescens var. hirtella]KAH6808308.1 DUF4228 domain protein [Perilla frutescens var. frutescens]